MKVLVINSGSSSLKYQLIETVDGKVLCKGTFERIGGAGAFYEHFVGDKMDKKEIELSSHADAIEKLFELASGEQIDAIGHRVVHGGEVFLQSTIATEENLAEVERLTPLAPLHNPANILGVSACMKAMPSVPNVMVFDTSFYSTMPKSAYLYALPMNDYVQHKIRKYGFHGTSHKFVSRVAAQMYGKPIEQLKIITCHIGNGCSVAAIDGGKAVETSLGMTPLEGLVMGTRSGDIDPAVVEVLCKVHGFSVSDCVKYLNKESGLLGLSGISNDMRDLMELKDTSEAARIAIDCFNHRITRYIGGFIGVMGGVDIIVWTGGIGNNNEYVREQVMKNFEFVGAVIDKKLSDPLNGFPGGKNLTRDISAKGARVKTFVICTNEELEIATETARLVSGQ